MNSPWLIPKKTIRVVRFLVTKYVVSTGYFQWDGKILSKRSCQPKMNKMLLLLLLLLWFLFLLFFVWPDCWSKRRISAYLYVGGFALVDRNRLLIWVWIRRYTTTAQLWVIEWLNCSHFNPNNVRVKVWIISSLIKSPPWVIQLFSPNSWKHRYIPKIWGWDDSVFFRGDKPDVVESNNNPDMPKTPKGSSNVVPKRSTSKRDNGGFFPVGRRLVRTVPSCWWVFLRNSYIINPNITFLKITQNHLWETWIYAPNKNRLWTCGVVYCWFKCEKHWLVVSTQLKHISQNGSSP